MEELEKILLQFVELLNNQGTKEANNFLSSFPKEQQKLIAEIFLAFQGNVGNIMAKREDQQIQIAQDGETFFSVDDEETED